ncbi:MAG: CcmD family protein [Chloroflexi bacterium]|nr:CcmD family protein [Chloroflexota bacterium]
MRFTRALRSALLPAALLVAMAATAPAGVVGAQTSPDYADQNAAESPLAPQPQAQDRDGESELPWLFAVFFVTWAAFFAYVFMMSRRQRDMQREIETLKRALAETDGQRQPVSERESR